jgi:hypothetical protein
VAQAPVTGGLFLGDSATSALADNSRFFVSQDQRNTVHVRARAQLSRLAWAAVSESYGSGLPAELGDPGKDYSFLLSQYGARVLSRVNFNRQRVRPSSSLDAAAGVDLLHRDRRSVTVEIEAANLTNRVNVINFASLFSGTAIAPSRSVSVQLRTRF